jgi:hypothetical protein
MTAIHGFTPCRPVHGILILGLRPRDAIGSN